MKSIMRHFFIAIFCLLLGLGVVYWLVPSGEENLNRRDAGDASFANPDRDRSSRDGTGFGPAELDSALFKDLGEEIAEHPAMPGERVVRAADEETYRELLSTSGRHGYVVMRTLDRFRSARLRITDPQAFRAWSRDRGLESSPNFIVSAPDWPDPSEASLDAYAGLGTDLRAFLNVEAGTGDGVTVAVLDSGIADHPAFASTTIKRIADGAAVPGLGHGTAMASIIAGNHPQTPGVAPGATLLDIPVLNNQGIGDTFSLAEGIIDAVDAGARIINLSLGSAADSPVVRDAVAYAVGKDVALVAAAGNEGGNQIAYPARLPGVIAVGASDAANRVLPFSNRGEGLDVVAPGYELQAAWPGEKVISVSGTSGSVGVVSGALAVLMNREPERTAAEATALLTQYADEAGAPGVDAEYGNGIINLSRVFERNTPGIRDVAVASQYLDAENGARLQSGEPGTMQVVVENRGTQPVYSLMVNTSVNGIPNTQVIGQLKPGEWAVVDRDVLLNYRGVAEVETVLGNNGADQRPGNDGMRTVLEKPGKP